MEEKRMMVLERLEQGDLTVAEAVALLGVLSAIEALDICCLAETQSLSISVNLN